MKYLSHIQSVDQTITVTLSMDMTLEFLQDLRALDNEAAKTEVAAMLGRRLIVEVFPEIK